MNLLAKLLASIFLIISMTAIISGLKANARDREAKFFFRDSEEMSWVYKYLDKRINFCDAPWESTRVEDVKNRQSYVSPSGRFRIKISDDSFQRIFHVIDTQNGNTQLTYSFHHDPKGAAINAADFKWINKERYLAFRNPITMDSDWATSKIYLYDVKFGGIFYLGDSEFYDCEARTW